MTKQIFFLTGSKGSGKTLGAFSFLRKEDYPKTFYVDTEDSASDAIKQNESLGLKLGKYVRAYERLPQGIDIIGQIAKGNLPWVNQQQKNAFLQYYDWFVKMLDTELKPRKYETFILDTVEPIEAAVTAYVEDAKGKAGWSGVKAYGRMETEGVRPLLDNLIEGLSARGVKRIILTSHVKAVWIDNKPMPNKVEPGGRLALWSRISSCMFWLVPSDENESGAPAALVLKARFGKAQMDGDFVNRRRILPRRMPEFSYRAMLEYEKNPANLTHPKDGETPQASEMQMMSEFLTDEQMRLMVGNMEIELKQSGGNIIVTEDVPSNGSSDLIPVPPLPMMRKA